MDHMPELQRCNRLKENRWVVSAHNLYNGYNYLFILGLNLTHVSKRAPDVYMGKPVNGPDERSTIHFCIDFKKFRYNVFISTHTCTYVNYQHRNCLRNQLYQSVHNAYHMLSKHMWCFMRLCELICRHWYTLVYFRFEPIQYVDRIMLILISSHWLKFVSLTGVSTMTGRKLLPARQWWMTVLCIIMDDN